MRGLMIDELSELATALARGECVQLPRCVGVKPEALARFLHAAEVERSGRFRGFLHVDARHIQDVSWSWWEPWAGAWVYLGGALDAEHRARLSAPLVAHGCVVLTDGGEELELSVEAVGLIRALAQLHDVAVDPELAQVRRSLMSHCRGESSVHLVGEHGAGMSRLVRWAHMRLDDRPMSLVRGGQGKIAPGQWVLFDEVSELGREQQEQLHELLRAREPVVQRWTTGGMLSGRARPEHPALDPLVGQSAAFVELLHKLCALAMSPMPILLTGEPGVGKELFARAVHELSGRKGAFVALDMGAMPMDLFEAQAFGHEKGAFTDAHIARKGAFERAHRGTIFLDEIGNLPLAAQVKLLRVLQERVIHPLGSATPRPIDVRVITATNADLASLTRQGTFRFDLLSRLDTATLHIPALRERGDDVFLLARHFIEENLGEQPSGELCSAAARELLDEYHWPGNVRELRNIITFAMAMSRGQAQIEPEHLGALSPSNRRKVPVLTTHSGDSSLVDDWGLSPHLARALETTTLRLPSLRERALPSRRHQILARLGGRPVRDDALEVLESYAWWGNLSQLDTTLSLLERLPDGPVTVELLEEHLPHLIGASEQAPIKLLFSPALTSAGQVTGLTWMLRAGAVVLGRARSIGELRQAAAEGDARAVESVAFLDGIGAISGEPACLELPFSRRLSRAHVLISYGERGLVAHQFPGARLRLEASALGGAEVTTSRCGGKLLGRAGEICLVHPRTQEIHLQCFVFAGESSFHSFSQYALARARARAGADVMTWQDVTGVQSPVKDGGGERLYTWCLDEHEREFVLDSIASFTGGMFKQHIKQCIEPYQEHDDYKRIVSYLERAPRLSQYVTRLFDFEANEALRVGLIERAEQAAGSHPWPELIPVGVRRYIKDA